MSGQATISTKQDRQGTIGKAATFVFGLAAYLVFLVTFLYAIGFVSGLVVPKTIDSGAVIPPVEAAIINLLLMALFSVQHSVMARRQFKQWWTRYVSQPVERSVYVLFASLALILLFWQWRPIPEVVWQIADPQIAIAVMALSFFGWLLVLTSTFLIKPLRVVRAASGGQQCDRPHDACPALQDACALQVRAPPDLSGLYHCLLGRAHDDRGTSAVCSRDDCLYFCRHIPRRARSDQNVW